MGPEGDAQPHRCRNATGGSPRALSLTWSLSPGRLPTPHSLRGTLGPHWPPSLCADLCPCPRPGLQLVQFVERMDLSLGNGRGSEKGGRGRRRRARIPADAGRGLGCPPLPPPRPCSLPFKGPWGEDAARPTHASFRYDKSHVLIRSSRAGSLVSTPPASALTPFRQDAGQGHVDLGEVEDEDTVNRGPREAGDA